ncbi:MAG: lipase family protein [Pseudomonas sp.]
MVFPTPRLSLIAASLLALLTGCAQLDSNAPNPVTQGPAGNAFYTPPTLAPGQHGDLIWARPLTNQAALPSAGQNWLVLYRSTDVAGQPVAVSGTVAIPKGTAPAGGWPVLSWTHGTTGIADICAPSRNDPDYPAREYVNLMSASLDPWLQRGYAVVQTDYQGLGTPGTHPYLVGDSEARGAIDIVLAARQLNPALGKNWLVMGHSQGGQAAIYTAARAPDYGQGLNLKGAIAIAPASHLSTLVAYSQAHPDTNANAYAALITAGIGAAATGLDTNAMLSAEGKKRIRLVEERCVAGLAAPDGWTLKTRELVQANADYSALNGALASLSDSENTRPQVPLLVLQADNDEVVPAPLTAKMVTRFKTLGVEVDARNYHIGDRGTIRSNHQATVPVSAAAALQWAQERLPAGQ